MCKLDDGLNQLVTMGGKVVFLSFQKEQHSQRGCQSVTCVTTMDQTSSVSPRAKDRAAPMRQQSGKDGAGHQETEGPASG